MVADYRCLCVLASGGPLMYIERRQGDVYLCRWPDPNDDAAMCWAWYRECDLRPMPLIWPLEEPTVMRVLRTHI